MAKKQMIYDQQDQKFSEKSQSSDEKSCSSSSIMVNRVSKKRQKKIIEKRPQKIDQNQEKSKKLKLKRKKQENLSLEKDFNKKSNNYWSDEQTLLFFSSIIKPENNKKHLTEIAKQIRLKRNFYGLRNKYKKVMTQLKLKNGADEEINDIQLIKQWLEKQKNKKQRGHYQTKRKKEKSQKDKILEIIEKELKIKAQKIKSLTNLSSEIQKQILFLDKCVFLE